MATLLYYSLISLAFILTLKFFLQRKRLQNLPPCPPTLPIIGNLHHLKPPLHRSLHSLSQKYGNIFSLWFGSRLVVVISSPTLVQECFTKHDIILANRPRFLTGKYLGFNYTSLGSTSYGDHFRNLRRIITIDVLSTHRLNSFFEIRKEETVRVVKKLALDTCKGLTRVKLRPRLTEMTFNNMMRMISGKRYYGENSDVTDAEEAKRFRDIISEMMMLLGANNKGDFLPLLRWFDFDGLEKRLKKITETAEAFMQGLVEEHRSGKHKANTMIEHLLSLQKSEPDYYSDYIIKGLIQELLLSSASILIRKYVQVTIVLFMATLLYYSLISLAFILTLKFFLQRKRLQNLPPCPPTLPIIGNLHHLKPPLHRSLHSLSQKYGNIFSLWFGSRLVVVISSPTLVQECFTKHDIILANRPRFLTGKYLGFNYTSLGSTSYGDHFRNLRRIITIDVLSTHRLNSFFEIRKEETVRVVKKLALDTCKGLTRVKLRPRLTEMTFNNMMRMISGKRYYGENSDVTDAEEAKRFRDIISEMMMLLGANNKGDFLPLLRWFDFDGLEKRLKKITETAEAFMQGLVEEHRSGKHKANTMIEHLLSLQKSEPDYYSDYIIKGLIQGMLLAGTDTTAVTIEWAMAALLNHPEILKKAKDELDTHVGQDRLVDESDIPNLPYIQNIIYETLRLYSPAPLLLPHYSSEEFNIGGFTVPRDTIVLINAWAIQRDPEFWSDPLCFKPERFEKEGEQDKLIPFGLGRRACPGIGLAYRTMGLTLGLLIQCFEWNRLTNDEIDMRETKGIAMPKLIPLEAMCKAQPISEKIMQ
ncbi:hypothetical protein RJT34_03945 [Clitoria ternatea]|uniref:Cytochrome P450 n=1 Tax=Clitoria ternatea TaxID=43366 RepID=A0AAN9KKQ2_CLITE